MKIKNFFYDNFWHLLGFLILFFVVVINLFPEGYVIAGEDTAQLVNLKDSFQQLFYDWDGRASLFYAFFYFLSKLGISETIQLSFYLGIFIFGAYISFSIFIRLVFGKAGDLVGFLTSLFYALNLYTLYIFTYSWGYSHYQILYVFIPVLTGLYLNFLRNSKFSAGAYFILVLFLASPGFANPAFAVSLLIFLSALTALAGATRYFKIDKQILKKLIVLALFSFLVSAYWILPIVPQINSGITNINTANIIDLSWWLQHTSNPVIDTLRLVQFNKEYFFPLNFPYEKLKDFKYVFVFLSFLPIFFIMLSVWQKKSDKSKKLFWIFTGMLIIFTLLVAKVRFPFEKINDFLFHLPGINILRGYEKLAIFTPFIISVLLLVALLQSEAKKYYKLIIGLFIVMLLVPLPFYAGKLQQNMSFIFTKEKSKDYLKADYSFLVKIPGEYYKIQPIINSDSEDIKVAVLPYNVVGSIGWVNYPKWKLQGYDIIRRLYNKPVIGANNFYFNQWLYAKDFNETDYNPEWIVKLLGTMNAKYILYHKDVDEEFIGMSLDKIKYLENKGILILLEENDYYCLYKISDDYIMPYLFLSRENFYINQSPVSVEEVFDNLQSKTAEIEYVKINPKKIIIPAKKEMRNKVIVFNEPYQNNWKAYYDNGKRKVELEHIISLGYANGWETGGDMEKGEIVIEYLPMKLFWRGALISLISLIFVISYIIYYRKINGRNNKKRD